MMHNNLHNPQSGAPFGSRNPPCAVLVSSPIRAGLAEAIDAGEAPRRDYLELCAMLGATLLAPPGPFPQGAGRGYRLLHRLGGHALAMAVAAWRRRGEYEVILTDQEAVGIPLALLFKLTGTRRRHVMISHYLTPAKKQFFFRRLRVQSHIDKTICYSSAQETVAREQLGLRPDQERLILHPADKEFWRPAASPAEREQDAALLAAAGLALQGPDGTPAPVIASAGREFRDYQTLVAAARQLPAPAQVVIASASPWSKRKDTTAGEALPANVHVVALQPLALRALYRRALAVAIPLYDVDFQAGSLVAYEALACGRPVVITRTRGQLDIVAEDVTGRYVPPGDPGALAAVLAGLIADPARAARMGRQARARVEAGLNLDTYLQQMVQVIREVAGQGMGVGGWGLEIRNQRPNPNPQPPTPAQPSHRG